MYSPHMPMKMAKKRVATLSNKWEYCNRIHRNRSATNQLSVWTKMTSGWRTRYTPLRTDRSCSVSSTHTHGHKEGTWWSLLQLQGHRFLCWGEKHCTVSLFTVSEELLYEIYFKKKKPEEFHLFKAQHLHLHREVLWHSLVLTCGWSGQAKKCRSCYKEKN